MKKRTLEYYLNLPYKIEVFQSSDADDPGWVAVIPDLPGCITQAETFGKLEATIQDAKRTWLEGAIEHGIPISEPRSAEEFSGKFVVRVPRSLHRKLVETAEVEGVSLNQYINVALASESQKHAHVISEDKVAHTLLKINQSTDEQNYYAAFKYFDQLIDDLAGKAEQDPLIDLLSSAIRSWRDDLNKFTLQILSSPPQLTRAGFQEQKSSLSAPPVLPEGPYPIDSPVFQDLFSKVDSTKGNKNGQNS